jgi:hypothetical protein
LRVQILWYIYQGVGLNNCDTCKSALAASGTATHRTNLSECGVLGVGCWVLGVGFMVLDLWFRVLGFRFGDMGVGFRARIYGFRVISLGLRV